MKTGTAVLLFAVFLVFGMFAIIHYEYAKTAGGYNFWLYAGIVSLVVAALIGVVGFAGQSKRK